MLPGCRWCKADVLRREWSCSRFQHLTLPAFGWRWSHHKRHFQHSPWCVLFDKLQRQFHTCLLSYRPNQLLSSPLVLHTTAMEWCSLPENKGATQNSSVTLDSWKGNGEYRFTISTFPSPVESFKSYLINWTLWKPSQIRKFTLAWTSFYI